MSGVVIELICSYKVKSGSVTVWWVMRSQEERILVLSENSGTRQNTEGRCLKQVDFLYIIMIVIIVYRGCKTQTQGSDFVRWCL